VQAFLFQEEHIEKIRPHFDEDRGPPQAKISPLDCSPNRTGFQRNELLKIDHFRYLLAILKKTPARPIHFAAKSRNALLTVH
jgi:hypothetical protein